MSFESTPSPPPEDRNMSRRTEPGNASSHIPYETDRLPGSDPLSHVSALRRQLREEMDEAKRTWTVADICGNVLSYLDRIADFDEDEHTAYDVNMGLGWRRQIMRACAGREQEGSETAQPLGGVLLALDALRERIAHENSTRADAVHQARRILVLEISVALSPNSK